MPIHFGNFALDLSTRELLAGAEPIHISPKAFQLLTILIQRRPDAISKKDLQDEIWPSTFVVETNLATLVAELREALVDDPRKPRFIRTVYGFGYAFCREASEEIAGAPVASIQSQRKPPPRLGPFSLLSIFVMTSALSVTTSYTGSTQQRDIGSIAILPFKVASPLASDEYFGLGIADVITTRLSNVRRITVRPTSAVGNYAAKGQDPVAAGRELQVDAVLDGTVRRVGSRIRVSVRLFAMRDKRAVWGETFDEDFTEAFKVEDSVADSIVTALALKLSSDEHRLLEKRRTDDSEAYRLYITGRYHLLKNQNAGWKESIPYFEAAVREDPSYALAYSGLSDAYSKQGIGNDAVPIIFWKKAEETARHALVLDEELSEAHSALGLVRMVQDRDWQSAEQEFRRALDLNPSNGLAHRYFAMLLQVKGRFDEAIAERQRARQLDPLSIAVNRELAFTYYLARRYDDAIRQQKLVLDLDPNYYAALIGIGQPLVAQNRTAEAIAFYYRAMAVNPDDLRASVWLARTKALTGDREEARRTVNELERRVRDKYVSPYHLAIIYNALGEREKAFQLLELAADQRSNNVLNVAVEPAFDALRRYPRYNALLRRLRLD